MTDKLIFESKTVRSILAALATGFAAGWGAYYAVQSASGRVSISVDRLKELEGRPAISNEMVEELQNRAKIGKEAVLDENEMLRARLAELKREQKKLQTKLLKNTPIGTSYVRNITLTPPSPATLRVGDQVEVSFDFKIAEERSAIIRVVSMGEGRYSYSYNSRLQSGVGRDEHTVSRDSVSEVNELQINIDDVDVSLYQLSLPVQYKWK